jgi:hypothetical protein
VWLICKSCLRVNGRINFVFSLFVLLSFHSCSSRSGRIYVWVEVCSLPSIFVCSLRPIIALACFLSFLFVLRFHLSGPNPSFCLGFLLWLHWCCATAFQAREFLIPRQVPIRCYQQCSRNRFSLPVFHLPCKVSRARSQTRFSPYQLCSLALIFPWICLSFCDYCCCRFPWICSVLIPFCCYRELSFEVRAQEVSSLGLYGLR